MREGRTGSAAGANRRDRVTETRTEEGRAGGIMRTCPQSNYYEKKITRGR